MVLKKVGLLGLGGVLLLQLNFFKKKLYIFSVKQLRRRGTVAQLLPAGRPNRLCRIGQDEG